MKTAVMPGDVIAVWFSCGAASAVAAKETLRRFGNIASVRIINTPIAEEDADNRRFLADVEAWLGVRIELVTHPKFPHSSCVEVWDAEKFMSAPRGAPCTRILKKEARQIWENTNHHDWLVLGFTAEEAKRAELFQLTERTTLLPVLIDAKKTKEDCFRELTEAGIRLPQIYKWGFPNANCLGCVKATSPTYWNAVRAVAPDVFAARAEQSRRLGAKLVRVRGKRIFLEDLDPNAKGRPMKSMKSECSLFCEERVTRSPDAG